jgi:hypothetical protein
VKSLDDRGPSDVADQLFDPIRSVEQGKGTNEDHLAEINDVHLRMPTSNVILKGY